MRKGWSYERRVKGAGFVLVLFIYLFIFLLLYQLENGPKRCVGLGLSLGFYDLILHFQQFL